VEPLIKTLKDVDSYVRGQSAKSLGKLKDPRAVEPLIRVLNDDYTYVKEEAARALGEIKNARAVEPLMNFLKDDSTYAREEAAKALIKIGPDAIAPLLKARNEKNLKLIADTYPFFLCRGEPGTEALLVDALVRYGTAKMAGDFARCGSDLLKDAAYEWAGNHKDKIKTPLGVGDSLVWGRCAS
jgi:HEAT repeat protein